MTERKVGMKVAIFEASSGGGLMHLWLAAGRAVSCAHPWLGWAYPA